MVDFPRFKKGIESSPHLVLWQPRRKSGAVPCFEMFWPWHRSAILMPRAAMFTHPGKNRSRFFNTSATWQHDMNLVVFNTSATWEHDMNLVGWSRHHEFTKLEKTSWVHGSPCFFLLRINGIRNWLGIPSGYVNIAIENDHLQWIYPMKMVILHSYVNVYQRVKSQSMF